MPGTVDRLKTHLGLDGARAVDVDAMAAAVEAANAAVAGVLRTDLPSPAVGEPWDTIVWPSQVDHGAVVLAARLYGRRSSVQGIATFGDAGVSFLARMDPDVRLLLGLGEYQPSVIA